EGQKFYLAGDSSFHFLPGDLLSITGRFSPVDDVSNIYAFSYSRYLKQKGIQYKILLMAEPTVKGYAKDYYAWFQELRHRLQEKTNVLFPDGQINAIFKAVGLGYKNDLHSETKQLFSETGTIHLLAVSGLHMGAVFYIILFILRTFRLNKKNSKLVVIPLLWSYACLTGLSPSVVRAAQILTFIIIGEVFTKDYSPLNCIAASGLFTLLVDKYAIYSLSMQMSYAAYTGIIIFFPHLKELPGKLPPLLSAIYSLLCISVAAQITTLPISAYYFHCFSITSLFINIIVVPLTSILLYVYLLLLALPLFISIKLVVVGNLLCRLMLFLLQHFHPFNWVLRDIYPSATLVILLYIFLFLFFYLMVGRKRYLFTPTLIVASLFIIYSSWHKFSIQNKQEVVIFHLYHERCILFNYMGYYIPIAQPEKDHGQRQYMPYVYRHKLKRLEGHRGFTGTDLKFQDHTLTSPNTRIRLVDKLHCIVNSQSNIWVIGENICPERVISSDSLYPQTIILDGSNNHSTHRQWEMFCSNKGILLRSTRQEGSIIISLQ
ncbi:ComEC family competence protein, partial [Odoribacter sp. OttesenSCG-928-A06]|nr:ComEC family competence protein [Odoribacter sp. OttesenSCG-928-A06]